MHYEVRFIEDAELPNGVDYVFARLPGRMYLFVKRSACKVSSSGECEALARAFATWERVQSVELKELAGAL